MVNNTQKLLRKTLVFLLAAIPLATAATLNAATQTNTALATGKDVHYSIATVAKGIPEHMDITGVTTQDGEKVSTLITDNSTYEAPKGYEFRYLIGSQIIKQKTRLINYRIDGPAPFRIAKLITKEGLDTVNRWGDGGGYYDKNAGASFTHNASVAFNVSTFIPSSVKSSGFLNPIPTNYNPGTQQSQWADISPDITLTNGRMFFLRKGNVWSPELLSAKGVKYTSHFELPRTNGDESVAFALKNKGITYNDVPRTREIFGLTKVGENGSVNGYNPAYLPKGFLTKAQVEKRARDLTGGLDALWIGETMEGEDYIAPDNQMYGDFYPALNKAYQQHFGARGIPWYVCHNYFMFWGNDVSLGNGDFKREQFKTRISMDPTNMPHTVFSPGATLSKTTLIMEGVYSGPPDIRKNDLYGSIYKMKLFRRMGYEAGVFLFAVHEWRPNNPYLYTYPDGEYVHDNKLPLDPNVIIAYAFISQRYGKVYVQWGGGGKKITKNWGIPANEGMWKPKGSSNWTTGNFPHIEPSGPGNYGGYEGGEDFSHFGLRLWNDTFGKVDGGTDRYLKFRIDGGAWIIPANHYADDDVDAFYDQRGIVDSCTKNGRTAYSYLNPYADNNYHRLELELPNGAIISEWVAGAGIHAAITH